MAFERLEFSKNWNSSADFPTLQTDEIQVRADMQLLHDESRNALNALMEALENGGRDALVRFGSEDVRYIRMNNNGGLEVSSDGHSYVVVSAGAGGSGGAAPAVHAGQHKTGGTDPIKPADIGAQTTVTGAATTITGSNLTANRALISNGSGKVAVSAVTATELGYLDGVTSGIQNQINGKAASGHKHTAAEVGAVSSARKINGKALSADVSLTAEDVGALALAGGVLTGPVKFNMTNPLIHPQADSVATYLRIFSGTGASDAGYKGGAGIQLYNTNHASNGGRFRLHAHDGTNEKALVGRPDGVLQWAGNEVYHMGNITAGTADLTAGSSALPTGAIYQVYE